MTVLGMNESEIPSATRRQSTLGLASPSKPLRNENEEKLNQMITQLQNENSIDPIECIIE